MRAILILTILLLFGCHVYAQEKLEVKGAIVISNSEGVPQEGTIRFNSTTNDFEGHDGIRWRSLTGRFNGDEGIFSGMVCFNGLASELVDLNPDIDIDGDGDIDKAAVVVFATDFLVRPDPEFTYSINRIGEAIDQNNLIVLLTCDDAANQPIEIHRWSGNNDVGFCETFVLVQDPNDSCQ